MTDARAGHEVTIVVNGQQLEFVERVKNRHFPAATLEELVKRALREWGPGLLPHEDEAPR